MDRKLKIKLVLATIFLVVVFLGIGALVDRHHKTVPQPSQTNLNEAGGPLGFSVTANLSSILTTAQFNAFYQTMSQFVPQNFGSSSNDIHLVGQAVVKPSGLVGFRLEVEPSKKQFDISLDRNQAYNKLVVSVPAYNFSQTDILY